jgi:hypothetical protein
MLAPNRKILNPSLCPGGIGKLSLGSNSSQEYRVSVIIQKAFFAFRKGANTYHPVGSETHPHQGRFVATREMMRVLRVLETDKALGQQRVLAHILPHAQVPSSQAATGTISERFAQRAGIAGYQT